MLKKLGFKLLCFLDGKVHSEFGATYKNSQFGKFTKLYENAQFFHSTLGDFSYVGQNTVVKRSKIGKFCSIGPDVKICLGMHPLNLPSSHPLFYSNRKQCGLSIVKENIYKEFIGVEINHDVWLGANSIISDGIKIGTGAVVAANSVVTKDVPPYAVVAGSPAKIIKYRFDQDVIELLIKSEWWEKDIEFYKKNIKKFQDIRNFNI